ncbi:hypothetical protein ES705_33781 [subsurface metagenome]
MLVNYKDKKFYETKVAFADKEFFRIFSYKFLRGSPENPFPDINSVLITKKIAEKYFGSEDPVGKIININEEEVYTISGVLKNIPTNSHLQFDFLGNFEILESLGYNIGWYNNFYYGYALLQDRVDYRSMGESFGGGYPESPWSQKIAVDRAIHGGVVSGGYPALLLSSYNPAQVIKGDWDSEGYGIDHPADFDTFLMGCIKMDSLVKPDRMAACMVVYGWLVE